MVSAQRKRGQGHLAEMEILFGRLRREQAAQRRADRARRNARRRIRRRAIDRLLAGDYDIVID